MSLTQASLVLEDPRKSELNKVNKLELHSLMYTLACMHTHCVTVNTHSATTNQCVK